MDAAPFITATLADGRKVDIELTSEAAGALCALEPGTAKAQAMLADIVAAWRRAGCPGVPYIPVGIEKVRDSVVASGPPGTATIELPEGKAVTVDIDADLMAELEALEAREVEIDEDTPMKTIYELTDARRAIEDEIGRRWARKGSRGAPYRE